MRINQSIKVLLILILLLPTVGRAEVGINNLGVTPIQPLYEIVGDTARLNCEMTFENTGYPLELVSWKVRAYYIAHGPVDIVGTPEDFWYNVRIRRLDNWPEDITKTFAGYFKNGNYIKGVWKIPGSTRVLFYLPYTDFPLSDLPGVLRVQATFQDGYGEKDIEFWMWPKIHSTDQQYIFPVGFDRFEKMGQSQEWFMGDHHPRHGDLHGSGHELYTGHRRVHSWWDGMDQPVLFNQRYAHDIAIRDASGSTHGPFPPGGFKTVQSYYAWGKKVFAMAEGKVVHVRKDIGDNPFAGVVAYPDGGGAGNRVIIEHPNGESSIYAHLQFGSIPVEIVEGAMISQGQVLGKVGNSGSSSEPHLHFTLQNRPVYEEHDCFPIRFVNISIRLDGEPNFQPWTTSLPSGVTIKIN